MANRMPMQPGDGSNPAGAQAYYHPQSGTPPQAMYMSFPMQYAQMQQAYTAQQQLQYQTFFENQRRAQADMRNRGAQMQGHPQQQQQQQQQLQAQQQAQRMAAMAGYPAGMMMHGGDTFEQKSQAEKEAILELLQTQSTTAKAFQQRGMPPQQQQQQQSRMSGYPGVGGERVGTFDPNNQSDKEAMLELLGTKSSNDTAQTSTTPPQQQQQQQQQQRMPGAAEHGGTDSFAHKTQAERDAMVELLPYSANQGRGFASRAQPPPPPPPPPQQQPQQQHRPGMTPGMPGAGMMAAAAVGPHFDPAIATAIASGSPAAAGAPPANMHMMTPGAAAGAHNAAMVSGNGGAASAAAAGAGRGKIEVEDEYGLKPLVKVLTAAPPMSSTPHVPLPDEPTDPTTGRPTSQLDADEINFSFITRGFDITQLGLSVSQQEWLHPTLATLPLDTHNYFILPEFRIPDSYKKPRPRSLSMKSFHQFKEETLFYIFYSMPRDVLHLAAARALYERGWRYHKREQHWFHPVKAADGTVMESVTTGPDGQEVLTGVFDIFQPNEWKQVRTADKYTVPMSEIEEQSVLVAAMEEAARQQTQRSRAKAAQAAAGAESGSPVNGSPAASP